MRKRWLIWLFLAAGVLGGGGYLYVHFFVIPTQVEEQPVLQTALVSRGDIVLSVDGTGNLFPAVEMGLGFRTGGLVQSVDVEVGDRVEAGQVLARLDTSDLEWALEKAELQLRQAQVNMDSLQAGPDYEAVFSARSNLEQAQISLDETIVSLSMATTQARMNWEQKANSLRNAQDDYSNTYWDNRELERELAAEGEELPDERIYAEQRAWRAVEDAARSMEQARMSYEQTLQKEEADRRVAELKVESSRLSLGSLYEEASEAEVLSAQISLEQARISLEEAQANLEQAVLRAPFAGTVLSVDVQVGQEVGTSSIITLADLENPLLRFWVEESDMSAVEVGHKVYIVFEALPDLTYSGKVTRIEPALVTVGNTSAVQAWASIDLSAHSVQLLSGMAAEVEAIEAEARNVLLVPLEALRELGEGQYAVFVIGADGELELRPVEVGLQDFVNAEIVAGLQAGEVVSLAEADSSSASTGQSPDQGRTAPGIIGPGFGPMGP